jgi:hypothetical protein
VDTASKLVVEDYADKPTTPKTTPAVVAMSKSTIPSPVNVVWAVWEEMKGVARKDVVAECMKRGVNVHTAKTQYQRWSATKKASPARA